MRVPRPKALSRTLARYFGRAYLRNLFYMVCILWSVIFMFNTLELMRRASKVGDVPMHIVLKMSILKLPDTGLEIFTFAILFSAIFTFWTFNRRSELVVVRAAGYSVWQIMAPSILAAVIAALLITSAANPFAAVLLSHYRSLEMKYLTHRHSEITLFNKGMWLRQEQDEKHYIILHAGQISISAAQTDWRLQDVMALYFGPGDVFERRIDAPAARLEGQNWVFDQPIVNVPGVVPKPEAQEKLPTDLTPQDIQDSMASPETMSVWGLPGYIRTLESTGFDATRLRIHFQALLALPLLYTAMVLLAASVSFHPPRFRSTFKLIVLGIFIGFITFFSSSVLQALGSSHQVPIFLAAWSPAFVMTMLGVAAMLSLEEA